MNDSPDVCRMALKVFAALSLIAMAVGALVVMGLLFRALQPVLLPVIVAGVLSYLLSRPTDWLEKKVKTRARAVGLVVSGAFVLLAIVGGLTIPPLVHQSTELVQKRQVILEKAMETGSTLSEHPAVARAVQSLYSGALADARKAGMAEEDIENFKGKTEVKEQLAAYLSLNADVIAAKGLELGMAGTVVLGKLPLVLSGALLVPFLVYYFLLLKADIAKNWQRLLPLPAGPARDKVTTILSEINSYFITFIRSQMVVSLIDALLLLIGLWILRLPYAFTLCVLAALLGVIPYIGIASACIPALLIAWFQHQSIGYVVAVGAVFALVSFLDNYFIQKAIVGKQLRMHDMTVMFSVLFWGYVLGGVAGILLGVPLTAAVKVLYRHFIWREDAPAE